MDTTEGTESVGHPPDATERRKIMWRFQRLVCLSLMSIVLLPSLGRGQLERLASTVPSDLRDQDLLALSPWSIGGHEFEFIFSQTGNASMHNDESIPIRTMTVYRKDKSSLIKIYEMHTADWFFSAHPLREDGRFLVIWGTGSAYRIRVYEFLDTSVQEVLDKASRDLPELSFDGKGRESILLTDPAMVNGSWDSSTGTTSVFKWSGKNYDMIGNVPWAKRFQCLSTQSCISSGK
jgi:hypothetical protein